MLKDEHGTSFQSHQEIASILTNHFSLIATEPNINKQEAINAVITSIPKLITDEQNRFLDFPITLLEVEVVVKVMANGKAPRLDGFTIDFFKACYDIEKQDIWVVVEDSRRASSILKSINSTFIALIPKEEATCTPSKF